ncbi:hypothetical protein CTI14_64580, partial [Methylobacterium radiotolerans]
RAMLPDLPCGSRVALGLFTDRRPFLLFTPVEVCSMAVRDYPAAAGSVSRLETVKAALRAMLPDLPCGSRVALGLFTDRRPFLLFTPVEVC